jgi:hypothetical protein
MAHHRYVPQFLLGRWARNGRVVSYRWSPSAGTVLENSKTPVPAAGEIADVNGCHGLPTTSHAGELEPEALVRQVETPAERALRCMIEWGVADLPADLRAAWARLIATFAIWTPETPGAVGAGEFRKVAEIANGMADLPPQLGAVVAASGARHSSAPPRNVPPNPGLELASDQTSTAVVAAMDWWLRRFTGRTILLCDRPLLSQPRVPYPCGIALDDPDCLIMLPVAPDTVFFATANPGIQAKIRKTPKGKLARMVNEETVWRAVDSVYAPDNSMAAFVHDRIVGKVKGRWLPK